MVIHPHDPTEASGAWVGQTATHEARSLEADHLLLRMRGLTSVEAGNVVAYVAGLHAAESGWTVLEVRNLVMLRALVARGVIEH
jgi:hypothetical protein